jgi:hypothetical protein
MILLLLPNLPRYLSTYLHFLLFIPFHAAIPCPHFPFRSDSSLFSQLQSSHH